MGAGKAIYPGNHKPGMKVPKGGSSCSSCKFVRENGTRCANQNYQRWSGTGDLPEPADEYCSDWWEPQDGEATTDEIREAFARSLDRRK